MEIGQRVYVPIVGGIPTSVFLLIKDEQLIAGGKLLCWLVSKLAVGQLKT